MPPTAGTFSIPPLQSSTGAHPYAENTSRARRKRSPREPPTHSLVSDELSTVAAEYSMQLSALALQLSNNPAENQGYQLRLYPVTLERAARLNLAMLDYDSSLSRADVAFNDEMTLVEEEWTNGKARVRARLLEGIEERRRKAREEKEAEGAGGELTIDAQARPHITRKVKEKMVAAGNSSPRPPSTPLFPHNENSLRIEDIATPFPLALSAMQLPPPPTPAGPPAGRRKGKGAGQAQSLFAKGVASYAHLTEAKESERDMDLGEIRRVSKRKAKGRLYG